MKKTLLFRKHFLVGFLIVVSNSTFSQTVSDTYTAGNISTNLSGTNYSNTCNGAATPLTVTLPTGGPWEVTSINIEYSMTAANGAWKSEQRSKIYCQNTTIEEPTYLSGNSPDPGTQTYNRPSVNIANGVYVGGTDLIFEMRAFRTWGGTACEYFHNQVDTNTWKITVFYTPSAAPPMTYTSSTVTQSNTSTIQTCAKDQEIIGIQIVTNGSANPFDATSFIIKTNGSTSPAITTNVSNIDIYYTGTSSTFATTTLFGSALPLVQNTNININGSQTLATGTNYFWVVYDINPSANIGDLLDARCNAIKVNGISRTPSTQNPSANRKIVACPPSPGGVNPEKLKTWYKTSNYTSGSNVWNNSAPNPSTSSLNSTSAPTYEASNSRWNYNPSLRFARTQDDNFKSILTSSEDLFGVQQGTIIGVGTFEGTNTAVNGRDDIGFCGYYGSLAVNDDELSFQCIGTWYRAMNETGSWIAATTPMNSTPSIHTSTFSGAAPQINLFRNSISNGTANNTFSFSNHGVQIYSIGEVPNTNHDFVGTIGEVITFAKDITQEERNRADSYLAIKYSITLGSPATTIDYNSSLGTTIWTGNTNFQRNIIGIGKDLNSGLLQKQSHQFDDSVRIYKGNLNSTNSGNPSTFSKDRSFVVMGASNGRLCATNTSNTELPPGLGLFSKLEREWRIIRTNMNETFNIDIKLAGCGIPGSVDFTDLRLLVDTDDNFANGNTVAYADGSSTGFSISYANGTISIKGISTTHIPNNTTRFFTIGSIKSATPLPVELTEFRSDCDNRFVNLSWSTASETNNDFFTIEKSIDGYDFETIVIIDGQGNKSTTSNYNYSDFKSRVGISYYRLSQTDFDGTTELLKTISSNCDGEFEISIYPNPTKKGVFVSLNNSMEPDFQIFIYNLLGKEITSHKINGSTYIPLPYVSGIYLFKYKINGIDKVAKIVKQ